MSYPNSRDWGLPAWYPTAFKWLVVATFALIALGGSVRVMNAGLACPDWPLCFGDVIPDYHPQVYFEFIHRVLAGAVSLVFAGLMYLLLFRSKAPRRLKRLAVFVIILLLTQVVFGGLTVLMQLHSKVVAAHLGMGTGFFAILMWMYLSLKGAKSAPIFPLWVWGLSLFILVAVYGQIILGGLVASHYAALVCTDFPTCHGQWFPTFRGIIGLHVIHRLGAYFVFLCTLVSWLVLRSKVGGEISRLAGWLFFALCVQVAVGISNVLFYTPPLIAVVHLAVGTFILSLAVRQLHLVTR